jgi:hypothetical protein
VILYTIIIAWGIVRMRPRPRLKVSDLTAEQRYLYLALYGPTKEDREWLIQK